MYGLYPAETNTRHLNPNQTSHAKPQIKVSDDILEQVQSTLKLSALPFNTQLYSVTSVEDKYDTLLPFITCKFINNYRSNATQTSDISKQIDAKYASTLSKFTAAMKTIEKDHAKDSYTSIDVNKYFDNIYARSFALLDTPGFTPDLL